MFLWVMHGIFNFLPFLQPSSPSWAKSLTAFSRGANKAPPHDGDRTARCPVPVGECSFLGKRPAEHVVDPLFVSWNGSHLSHPSHPSWTQSCTASILRSQARTIQSKAKKHTVNGRPTRFANGKRGDTSTLRMRCGHSKTGESTSLCKGTTIIPSILSQFPNKRQLPNKRQQ